MKKEKEESRPCGNAGCGRPAEKGSLLCDSCALEWSLFHREVRGGEDSRMTPPPAPAAPDGTLPVS